MTWLIGLKTKIVLWLSILGAALVALWVAYRKGSSNATQSAELKIRDAQAEGQRQYQDAVKNASDTAKSVADMVASLPKEKPRVTVPAPSPSPSEPVVETAVKVKEADPNSSQGRLGSLTKGGMVIVATWFLYACSPVKPTAPPTFDMCGPWKAIIPNGEDALTTSTSDQILVHDCLGYRLGCWKPDGIEKACSANPVNK